MSAPAKQRHALALEALTSALLAQLTPAGHWSGELSASALSTATAVIALTEVDRREHGSLVESGLRWLAQHANPDGGWGDTVRSRSNLSTTALAWAAFATTGADTRYSSAISQAESWIVGRAGSLENLIPTIEAAYGKDRTFSVPITMTLALSGRLGVNGWKRMRPLPFELAALPSWLFGALQLPVVSYALPALIAIGQVSHHFAPSRNPLARAVRRAARHRTLRRLETIQPRNGGFLEATPLTSFVVMSLAAMGHKDHPVVKRGAAFLSQSARPDGSWPIDTNLSTWVTTLSIKALSHQPDVLRRLPTAHLQRWLLNQQYRSRHPYTHARPGGWAWTNLPGGVPDADDTAGALLALWHLDREAPATGTVEAARRGVNWLLDLQNRDGGLPTFCRGWGALPFDRSTPELTAHTLRAWNVWAPHFDSRLQSRLRRAVLRAHEFLGRSQRPDGSWLPLWFGNEHAPDQENAVYGTAQVLLGLCASGLHLPAPPEPLTRKGVRFLKEHQNADGGWGGRCGTPSSIEETSLALEALVADESAATATTRGLNWLLEAVGKGVELQPTPIGLYFARLWYFERLYPVIFASSALAATLAKTQKDGGSHAAF